MDGLCRLIDDIPLILYYIVIVSPTSNRFSTVFLFFFSVTRIHSELWKQAFCITKLDDFFFSCWYKQQIIIVWYTRVLRFEFTGKTAINFILYNTGNNIITSITLKNYIPLEIRYFTYNNYFRYPNLFHICNAINRISI